MSSSQELGSDPGPLPDEAFPTDPAKYTRTEHFENRAADDDRLVTDELVANAIKYGELQSGGEGSWKFVKGETGLDIHVVCALGNELNPAVVTAYADVWNGAKAIINGQFDNRRVKVELFRNVINRPGRFDDRLRTMSLTPAHRVKGHNLKTHSGDWFVECVDCGKQFHSKDEIVRSGCE